MAAREASQRQSAVRNVFVLTATRPECFDRRCLAAVLQPSKTRLDHRGAARRRPVAQFEAARRDPMLAPPLEDRLLSIAAATPWLARALGAVAALGLPRGCIGAGAIRNAVWDALHGLAPALPADIDVAYFDAGCLDPERDDALLARLRAVAPDLPWEVTNQAAVHLWFEQHFGHAVDPLVSIEDAVASWPETATSVAIEPLAAGPRVIAPLGLDDLFGLVVRRNPRRVSVAEYRRRCAAKRYRERWPRVAVIDG
jgi:hypothetical protein